MRVPSKTWFKVPVKPQKNQLKIVIVGEGGVGKSSMTLRFINDLFHEGYDPTIDDSFITTIIVDETPWEIEITDTAGQEEYCGLWMDHSVSQGDAFIVTYSIDSMKSFQSVPKFLDIIKNPKSLILGLRNKENGETPPGGDLLPQHFPFPFAIAGNKLDLSDHCRAVPTSVGAQLAKTCGGLFFECSAKTNINVQTVFIELVRSVKKLRAAALFHCHDPEMNQLVNMIDSILSTRLSDLIVLVSLCAKKPSVHKQYRTSISGSNTTYRPH
ncbi:hypothetical protein CROQUDRAFT_697007 [Cronartium quercuum f. sp. fusiforme G11]|uniref:Uncharacterized protein n=1 Tax=Cronartium quercuum f. sp. fusiforme G11 TaxID=708437 RepID=A0A9P6NKM5_9BASI|nr:hypothetical protein CROQUDRAFT_697007 [Cronartium quercuum f. sp. fusiforme G11]